MVRNSYLDEYFEWICRTVCGSANPDGRPYRLLLGALFNTTFSYTLPMDGNRASDGIDMRYRYGREHGIPDPVTSSQIDIFPCSVLEMMLALCIRCEEHIMEDCLIGDRTSMWFWAMIESLGLSGMSDRNYNDIYVNRALLNFMSRNYEPNGKGGLFTINAEGMNDKTDLRKLEIWYQLHLYLTTHSYERR